jgi:hypothetical protein
MPIITEELHIGNQPDVEHTLACPCGDTYLKFREVVLIPGGVVTIGFTCETSGCRPTLILHEHKGEMFVRWRSC